ncbi:hypothetical protein DFH09DRAFT_1126739 [Mycena vulgaris]|nr:hypothetical protein DFH09DRAFT_1126739 [Mycena vulgaris]
MTRNPPVLIRIFAVLHVSIELARTRASNTFILGPLFVHFLRFAVPHRLRVVGVWPPINLSSARANKFNSSHLLRYTLH